MQKFELVLKNEKEKTYEIISWIIVVGNILSFATLSAITNFQKLGMLIYVALVIISIIIPRYFKNQGEKQGFGAPFFIIILGWLKTRFWWMMLVNCVFMILDTIARRKLIVHINTEKISYPSWPEKEIKWFELNNVVLKDRLLTIDLKNNKLYQQEVINGQNDYDIDENEFNNFCKEQLNKAELYKLN